MTPRESPGQFFAYSEGPSVVISETRADWSITVTPAEARALADELERAADHAEGLNEA